MKQIKSTGQIKRAMRTKVTQFFCTRPLVAFVGVLLGFEARSDRYQVDEVWPGWVTQMSTVIGLSAVIIALWVMFAPAPHLHFRKWMGWALLSYWAVRGIGSLVHGARTTNGLFHFTEEIGPFYGWTIIAVLGLLMIVAPNPYHLWDESHGPKPQNNKGKVRHR